MSLPKVAVIVVNWNRWTLTLRCLESLQPAVRQGLARILIIDNASTDDSVEQIRGVMSQFASSFIDAASSGAVADPSQLCAGTHILIRGACNHGYAAGNNLGINLALQLPGTEYVFLLNNDATVDPNCIERLWMFAEGHVDIGVFGATLIEDHGRTRIAGGARYHPLLTTNTLAPARWGKEEADIDYVAGAAMFIRCAVLKTVGLLSEEYFLFFEEVDFARRAMDAGYKVGWCAQSLVYHDRGATTGSPSGARKKSTIAEYHSNISCLIFTQKFYPRLLWAAAIVRFFLKMVHNALLLRPVLMVPLCRAYLDYFGRTRTNRI